MATTLPRSRTAEGGRSAGAGSDLVDLEPLRARFLELESNNLMSRTELARALGWYREPSSGNQRSHRYHGLVPDTGRVTRVLGLKSGHPKRQVSYDNAVRLCRALHLDPVDVGV